MVINALNSGASTFMADFEGGSVHACLCLCAASCLGERAVMHEKECVSVLLQGVYMPCCTCQLTPAPQPPAFPPIFRYADSHAPTWSGNLDGHINLRDALARTISFTGANGEAREGGHASCAVLCLIHALPLA